MAASRPAVFLRELASFSIGKLVRDAQRLLGALQDGTIGTAVVGHLSAEFVADFTARLALVAKLDNDQSTAFGVVSSLTAQQNKARKDFALLTQVLRVWLQRLRRLRTLFQLHRPRWNAFSFGRDA